MYENWKNVEDQEELSIIKKYAKRGTTFTKIMSVEIGVCMPVYCFTKLLPAILNYIDPLVEPRPLTNIAECDYYFFDWEDYYVLTFLHYFLAACLVVLVVNTVDDYYCKATQHACGMFDILRFADLIERTFTYAFFLTLFTNMLQISITALHVIRDTSKSITTLNFMLICAISIARLFYLSYAGQTLLDHSSKVDEYVYNCEWYDFPPKAKKLLLLMLVRSSRPCYLTAGKIMGVNLITFSSLIKSAVSYATVILSTSPKESPLEDS
ncbi:odorant receptor 9a-like [Copidosoma floridanum]|uniref:odorant receptor 9a-like n=1 Tax=Copidosoma floridanum TaxID=29053 RepID=UPI000C6F902F|nr:odorant receptor 9a-like [Copidosoma floridanum]